jgi:hypothetical protein
MGIQRIRENLMVRVSSSMFQNASKLHCTELEQLWHRSATASQYQGILNDLKDQLVRKAALRTQSVFANGSLELPRQVA